LKRTHEREGRQLRRCPIDAGWSNAPHVIGEQRTCTNGHIIVTGGRARRGKQKRADYLIRQPCR